MYSDRQNSVSLVQSIRTQLFYNISCYETYNLSLDFGYRIQHIELGYRIDQRHCMLPVRQNRVYAISWNKEHEAETFRECLVEGGN